MMKLLIGEVIQVEEIKNLKNNSIVLLKVMLLMLNIKI